MLIYSQSKLVLFFPQLILRKSARAISTAQFQHNIPQKNRRIGQSPLIVKLCSAQVRHFRKGINKNFNTDPFANDNQNKQTKNNPYIPEIRISFSNEGYYTIYNARKATKSLKYSFIPPGILALGSSYFLVKAFMRAAYFKTFLWTLPVLLLYHATYTLYHNSFIFIEKIELAEDGKDVMLYTTATKKKKIPIKKFAKCDESTFKNYAVITRQLNAEYFPIYIDNKIYFIDRHGTIEDSKILKAILNGIEIDNTIIADDEPVEEEPPENKEENVNEKEQIIDI